MEKLKILLTGATGIMGVQVLNFLIEEEKFEITAFSLSGKEDKKILKPYMDKDNFKVLWGDIRDYEDVKDAVKDKDVILHVAALVSPLADSMPELAMEINYGGTLNLLESLEELGQNSKTYFVYIGTVAQTGDRLPPIHWGRVGDPIKPSINDYYAVSKVASEREIIESNIKHWVSLRQTGIMSKKMAGTFEPIILHNPLNNVLEYVSDRDSGRLLYNLCMALADKTLADSFWNHIYNVGGGKACRASTLDLYANAFAKLGINNLHDVLKPNWFASQNFHGQYYLDSDKLEDVLHFRHDTIDYFYDSFDSNYGIWGNFIRKLSKISFFNKIIKFSIRSIIKKLAKKKNSTLGILKTKNKKEISALWSTQENWLNIPEKLIDFKTFKNWNKVQKIDHGYDENKAATELNIEDLKKAALFRGGSCDSSQMLPGDWAGKLEFTCGFGHHFKASPRLILEGGYWCPTCEDTSWNYAKRANKDDFFAQVWNPLHGLAGPQLEYKKKVRPSFVKDIMVNQRRFKKYVKNDVHD